MPQKIEQDDVQQNAVNPVREVLRYVVILGLVVVGIWYYMFNKPPTTTLQWTEGKTMGTAYSVKVYDFPDNKNWSDTMRAIQDRLDAIDQAMSTFKPDSDVSRFNASDSTEWFSVSLETAQVVQTAQQVSRLTGGTFDITVAPLVDLWGFGPEVGTSDSAQLEEESVRIKERIGYAQLDVQMEPPALKKKRGDLTIDLSAIAKGFAVDKIGELLEGLMFKHYMVEVGGEVRCAGNKGSQGEWTIGIEKPLIVPPGVLPGLQRKILLGNKSLATSGDYQNYREIDGVRYSHIIDPRTGFPTERLGPGEKLPAARLGAVSVIDKSCVRADALATALFVLGPQEGLELAQRENIAVLFLMRTGDKDITIMEQATTLFPVKLKKTYPFTALERKQ